MKQLLTLLLLASMPTLAKAQFQVNPQIGATLTKLTGNDPLVEYKASVGFAGGVDFRIGDRLYFQPGFFLARNVTVVKYTFTDTVLPEDDLIRTSVRIKALVGYNLVNGDAFKLRLNAGPTYDVLLSIDHAEDDIAFDEENYNAGSFNMDAGLGVDLAIISLEAGVSYGLSNAYKDSGELQDDAKYFTFYATLGVVIGKGGGD